METVVETLGPKTAKADWGGAAGLADYIHFFHTDHLGSTRVVTDLSGDVYERIDYLPFGEIAIDNRAQQGEFGNHRFKYVPMTRKGGNKSAHVPARFYLLPCLPCSQSQNRAGSFKPPKFRRPISLLSLPACSIIK